MKISIIDYGMGNLKSIYNAFKHISEEKIIITSNIEEIQKSDAYILPGVGAFRDAMKNLSANEIADNLSYEVIQNEKPVLGICLGMQLLFSSSYEGGNYNGLNWIDGKIELMKPGFNLRIPHVGWNDLITKKNRMFEGLGKDKNVYFVHSYCANTDEKNITAKFEYGNKYTAAVQKDNIWGMQFHPEKSQRNGFQLLRNFISYCKE